MPGSIAWSGQQNSSFAVPVTPTTTTVDLITVPPGMVTDTGPVLILAHSVWDGSGTNQSPAAPGGVFLPVFTDSLSVEHSPTSGTSSTPIDSSFSFFIFGGFGFSTWQSPTLTTALLNGGGTLRLRASVGTFGVTAKACVVAAILNNSGTSLGTNILLFSNFFKTNNTGTFSPTPGPTTTYNDFLVCGGGLASFPPLIAPSATAASWAGTVNWSNVVNATNGIGWAGIGFLSSPPDFPTTAYSFTPDANFSSSDGNAQWEILAITTQAAAAGRSFGVIIA